MSDDVLADRQGRSNFLRRMNLLPTLTVMWENARSPKAVLSYLELTVNSEFLTSFNLSFFILFCLFSFQVLIFFLGRPKQSHLS
jgi:hypothetical protein